jgi:hypothetical protein
MDHRPFFGQLEISHPIIIHGLLPLPSGSNFVGLRKKRRGVVILFTLTLVLLRRDIGHHLLLFTQISSAAAARVYLGDDIPW